MAKAGQGLHLNISIGIETCAISCFSSRLHTCKHKIEMHKSQRRWQQHVLARNYNAWRQAQLSVRTHPKGINLDILKRFDGKRGLGD